LSERTRDFFPAFFPAFFPIGALTLCFAAIAGLWATGAARVWPVAVQMGAYLFYGWLLRDSLSIRWTWRTVFAAALAVRLPLLFVEPAYSDDLFRYMWEGRVQRAGFNPYAIPPDAPALAFLDGDGLSQRVNHPHLAAIYPPFAQMTFALGALMGADGSARAFKASLVGWEFLAMGAMALWLKRRRRGPKGLLLYALNPLVVVEVAGNGHYDFLVAGAMALFFWALLTGRGARAGICLGLAIATKFLPVVLAPFLLFQGSLSARKRPSPSERPSSSPLQGAQGNSWERGQPPKPPEQKSFPQRKSFQGSRAFLAMLAALGVLYFPYLGAGRDIFGSLGVYALKWQRNAPIFPAVEWAAEESGLAAWLDAATWTDDPQPNIGRRALGFHPEARHAQQIAKRIVALAWLALAGVVFWRAGKRWRRRGVPPALEPIAEALVGAALLMAPILYPWYLLLLFPMLLGRFRLAWHWVFALTPLFYLPVASGAEPPLSELAARWIVFGPAAMLLLLAERKANHGRPFGNEKRF
jgi:hypothetical protein